MSDVNANIGIEFDTSNALAQLRQLQAGLSKFNQSLTEGNVAAANAQKGLNAQLVQSINATGKFVASQKTITSSTASFTDALEKNKLSMGQYFRYTSAAATQNSKVFSNAFKQEKDVLNRAMKDRVKSLQTQYVQLTSANGDLVKVLQVIPKHLKTVNGQYADYATRTQMAAQRQQFLNQLIKQGSTQLLNFGKNTQWAGRQLMVGLTVPLTMLGSVAAKAFKEMEQATIKFTRVYGDMVTSVSDTDKAVKEIQMLAKEFTKFGIAATETMTMAADAAAMGLTGAALQAQVINATKLAVLGQVEQQQALETTISLTNAFGIASEDLAKKINFLNAVENQTVLSIEDLTIAIPKAGPVVKQLGGSVEDLAFFMTAMKEGGINASEGANALKSGLASMINPSKKASEFLGGLGINIKGLVEANKGDLKGTVVGFSRALDTLDPLNRARAIEQLFGKFQFARLSTLFKNVTSDSSQAARALGLAGASVEELAILSERELGKVENAVGVKFQKQLENIKLQLVPIGKAFLEAVTPVVKFAGTILEKFNNLSDGTKKFVVGFIAILGGIAPVALMTVGLVANGVANLIKFFGMLRGGMAKLNGQNNVLGGGFDYLTQAEIDNIAQTEALHVSHKELISTFNVEKSSVDLLAQAYANAATQARALASGSPGLFNATPGAAEAVSGLPKKFASGGLVPGTGNGDTVPALLTPGEFVVTKDNVKKNPEIIAALSNDSVKKFSEGGMVGSQSTPSAKTPGWLQKEYDRIATLSDSNLKRYAELTGMGVDKTMDEIRQAVLKNFEELLGEVKTKTGSLTKAGLEEIGKAPGANGGPSIMGKWFKKFDEGQGGSFAHVGQTEKVSADNAIKLNVDPKIAKQMELVKKYYEAKGQKAPDVRVADAFGFTMQQSVNRGMASEDQSKFQKKYGTTVGQAFQDDFAKTGAEKWRTMTELVGENFDKVKGQAEIYDKALLAKVTAWNTENSQKAIPDPFTDDVFRNLEVSVREDVASLIPDFAQVIETAKRSITALRTSIPQGDIKDVNAMLKENNAGTLGPKGSNAKYGNVEARQNSELLGTIDEFPEQVDDAISGGEKKAETQSPSKRTRRLGVNIGEGLRIGLEQKTKDVKSQADSLYNAALPKVDVENQAKYDALKSDPYQRQIQKSIDRNNRNRFGAAPRVVQPAESTETSMTVDIDPQALAADIAAAKAARKRAKELDKQASEAEAVAADLRIKSARWEAAASREDSLGNKNSYPRENADGLNKLAAEAELKAAQLRIQAAEERSKASKKSKKSGSMTDAGKSAKAAAREAGKTRNAQEEVTIATEDVAREQVKHGNEVKKSRKKAKKTADASGDVLVAESDVARSTQQTADASRTQAQNTVTAAELTQATENSLQTSSDNNEQIVKAEDDRVRSAEEIAKLENDIEAQKRKMKEEGMRAVALQQQQNSIIPDGAQTDNSFVNPITAMGYEAAYDEASTYTRDKNGNILFDPEFDAPTTLNKKQLKQKARGMRREKVSKFSGKVSGGLGTAAMVAGMAGAPPQVTAALGGAATVAQFAPMIAGLSGPQGAVAALAALAAGAYLLNKKLEGSAVAIAKFTRETSVGAGILKKIGEQTGKVGANEVMNRRRSEGSFDQYIETGRKGTTEAQKFLEGEAGKAIQKAYVSNATKNGAEVAARDFALQIASAISDGTIPEYLGPEIARQVGINLKDVSTGIRIDARIRSLIGPKGEDLLKNPLEVRTRIALEGAQKAENIAGSINNNKGGWANNESGSDKSAAFAVAGASAIEVAQAQSDAMSLYYETQIKSLEVDIAATTNKEKQAELQQKLINLTKEQEAGMARMNNLVAAQITRQEVLANKLMLDRKEGSKQFAVNSTFLDDARRREDAFFDAQKADVKAKYKGTEFEASAQRVLDLGAQADEDKSFSSKAEGRTFEAKVNFIMQSGQMNPAQLETMMKIFKGDLKSMDTALNVGIRTHGGSKMAELASMLTGIDTKKAKSIILTMSRKNPAEFDKVAKTIAILQRSDGLEVDMEAFINVVGMPGLNALSRKLDAIEALPDPITKEVAVKWATDNGIDPAELIKDWEYYDDLKPEVRKEALQTYTTMFTTATAFKTNAERDAWAVTVAEQKAAMAGSVGSKEYNKVYKATFELLAVGADGKPLDVNSPEYKMAAGTWSQDAVVAIHGSPTVANSKDADGGPLDSDGKERDTTYDELNKRLRNVRLASINAAGGIKELTRALAKTGIKAISDQFRGLEQQLIKTGKAGQFVDYLAGLDQDQLNKFGKAATKKNIDPNTGKKKSGVKVGDFILNDKGQKMEKGYNKAIIGDYNKAQLLSVTLNQQEIKARTKLLALGFEEADIKTMLADENYRALIATNKVTKAELATNAALTKQERLRNQISSAVAGGRDLAQTAENQKRIPEVVQMMQMANISAEGIRSAISDPSTLDTLIQGMDNFATLGQDAQGEFRTLLDQINDIPSQKIIELVFTQTTEQKQIAGAEAAMQLFDAYKQIDENTIKNADGNTYAGLQAMMEDLNNQAKIVQNGINLTQSRIDDLQKEVDKDQRDIENNFTRPIDAKQRSIDKLNRSAEINFTRPIQALQERSSILSHDLEVMNHAAEEINKKYDKQQKALAEVAKVNQQIIQQQQQQLGLADALSKGDISAAAKAVQDMRATNASNYAQNSQEALQKARENEISGLKGGVSGLTQDQIQEEQYQIGLQTYDLELKKAAVDKQILAIQDEIYALEQARQIALDAIQVKTDKIASIVNGELLTQQTKLKAITDENLKYQDQIDKLAEIITKNDKVREISGLTRAAWDATLIAAKASELLLKGDLALALGNAATESGKIQTSWEAIKKAYDAIQGKSLEVKQQIETAYGDKLGIKDPSTDAKLPKDQTGNGEDAKVNALSTLSSAKTTTDINNAVKSAQAAGVTASTIANGMIAPLIASGADAASAAVTARWTGQGLAFQQQEDARKAAEKKAAEDALAARAAQAERRAKQGGYLSKGGIVPSYFAAGGYARGTDTVPAMLTPGEFVMSRYAVETHGVNTMKAINSGSKTSTSDSVYNYNLSVNVKSDANPDDIARTVMTQIRQIDAQRIRGNRF